MQLTHVQSDLAAKAEQKKEKNWLRLEKGRSLNAHFAHSTQRRVGE